jgi:hypothetical protein
MAGTFGEAGMKLLERLVVGIEGLREELREGLETIHRDLSGVREDDEAESSGAEGFAPRVRRFTDEELGRMDDENEVIQRYLKKSEKSGESAGAENKENEKEGEEKEMEGIEEE